MADDEAEAMEPIYVGALQLPLLPVRDPCEEVMLLWGLRNPSALKQGGYVAQNKQELVMEACGHVLQIQQAPSSLMKAGVTGSVMWDSGIVLAKFLEHAADQGRLELKEKRMLELGAGCGLVGIVAALLGSHVVLTDVWDRLRLLQKNVNSITHSINQPGCGSALVHEHTWGEEPPPEWLNPQPDFVVASDVVFGDEAISPLIRSLLELSGPHTTILLAAELRNDVILEAFLSAALAHFDVGRLQIENLPVDYRSQRVVLYGLVLRRS